MEELWGFHEFLNKLERDGRIRQCFDEFDKKKLEGKKWSDVLHKQVVVSEDDIRQVTFVSVRESARFGGNVQGN